MEPNTKDRCPRCDRPIIYAKGCTICRNCGYTTCEDLMPPKE